MEFCITFFMAHIIHDYYMQDDKMAILKNKSLSMLIKHALLFGVAMVIPMTFYYDFYRHHIGMLIILTIINIVLHFIVDKLKPIIFKNAKKFTAFWMDQLIHLVTMGITIYIAANVNHIDLFTYNYINNVALINISLLIWMLVILHKPGNILIGKIFFTSMPPIVKEGRPIESAALAETAATKGKDIYISPGEAIGTLERIIVFILVVANQFGAISFIIAAKSIARFDKIKENESNFRDKFLIGTLTSCLVAIVCGIAFNYLKK